MFIELERQDIVRFYHDIETDEINKICPLHIPNVTINTDHIVSMIECKNSYGEFDYTEILVTTGKVYKVTERVSEIKEEIRRHESDKKNVDAEYKVLDFDKVNRNGTIISKDAFKDQDGIPIPLKWGSGPDAEVLGTVELNLELDGVYMSISKEDYENIKKMMEDM